MDQRLFESALAIHWGFSSKVEPKKASKSFVLKKGLFAVVLCSEIQQ